jgi:hypothetical protein
LYTTKKPFRSVEDVSIITASDVNKYRILMFRDSFGNAIIPFISNNFGYAYYSKEYPVTLNDIEKHNPDIVVQEIAQRNIPKLIEKAPFMPAVKRDAHFSHSNYADGSIFTENNGQLIHIYGYLDYDNKKPYRCYVTDTGDKTFEAFPILEAGKMADKLQSSQNAVGFSMYLKKTDFMAGNLLVTIDYSDKAISHTFMLQGE